MIALLSLVAFAGDPALCTPPDPSASAGRHAQYGLCLASNNVDVRSQFEAFNRALQLDPHHQLAVTMAANLATLHRLPEAPTLWAAVRSVPLTDAGALSARARLAAQQAAWPEARRDLDAAVALQDAADLRLQRAEVAFCTGDATTARSDAAHALGLLRNHGRLRACWIAADLDRREGRMEAALTTLRRRECRGDRSPSNGTFDRLGGELEGQLEETFGADWRPVCASER